MMWTKKMLKTRLGPCLKGLQNQKDVEYRAGDRLGIRRGSANLSHVICFLSRKYVCALSSLLGFSYINLEADSFAQRLKGAKRKDVSGRVPVCQRRLCQRVVIEAPYYTIYDPWQLS